MKGGPILISQFKRRMRQIILNVEDAAYEQFMGMVALCPQVKVVCDGIETGDSTDLCIVRAIREMRENGAFRYPSDYTYIMVATNEGMVKGIPFFYSPKEYLDYMKELGLDGLPGRTTLYDTINKMRGRYPDWSFSDSPKTAEILRRKNIVKQFLSAFGRARRGVSDGVSENP